MNGHVYIEICIAAYRRAAVKSILICLFAAFLLAIEQVALIAAGLILGVLFMFLFKGGAFAAVLPEIVIFAAAYLTSIIIAASVSAAAAAGKKMLVLLQTKE